MREACKTAILGSFVATLGACKPTTAATSAVQDDNATPASVFAEFCPALSTTSFSDFDAESAQLTVIDGKKSKVVVDDGQRVLKTRSMSDCGGGRGSMTFRWTDDTGGGLAGGELFVRDDTSMQVVGLALNASGVEIAAVPQALANDKSGMAGDQGGPIQTRAGCQACHPNASYRAIIPNPKDFWSGTDLVTKLDPPAATGTETATGAAIGTGTVVAAGTATVTGTTYP